MTIFAEQLKSLRTARNLSQDNLAEQLYISRQAISKWENGDAAPDMDNLIKLASILEVSLDELMLGRTPEVKVERIVETRENHQMNAWEFLADYWWLLFPVGAFLYGLFAAVMKVLQKYG
ncbi:helix-turn-helix domain-containing protein [Streptococcus thoraltensis]